MKYLKIGLLCVLTIGVNAYAETKEEIIRFNNDPVRKKKLDQCVETQGFKRAKAARDVKVYSKELENIHKRLRDEERIEKISGVQNYQNRYSLGQRVVSLENYIEGVFAYYKRLGGTAATPDKIGKIINPCEPYFEKIIPLQD